MATTSDEKNKNPPEVILTASASEPGVTSGPKDKSTESNEAEGARQRSHHLFRSSIGKHVRLEEPSRGERRPISASSSIYMGSYSRSPRRSRVSLSDSLRAQDSSVEPSPRTSISQGHLEHLLRDVDINLDSYGVEEFRDGFFDALFFKPPDDDREDLMKMAEYTLPAAFRKRHPLSPTHFLPKQWHEMIGVLRRTTTTRAGIKLVKSFLGFFIAYILCLIPVTGNWLGRYNYVMVLSAIINHPGRTIGAQLDGAFLTILGTAGGLGWGAFALYVSDSSSVAASGYGGVLAAFLVVFMGTIAALRSYFIRFYQMVLCAGIAIIYTCLSETSRTVNWAKLLNYGIPWLFGQALCLVICCSFFPDAGARPLAVALHDAFAVMDDGLKIPRSDHRRCHRELAWTFVNLSQAYRDLVLDISITRFRPSDILDLRNLMQAVVRSLLALKTKTTLFEDLNFRQGSEVRQGTAESFISVDAARKGSFMPRTESQDAAVKLVRDNLAEVTQDILSLTREALARCDAVLLGMSGYRKFIGPPATVSSDVLDVLVKLRRAMIEFDEMDNSLMENPQLPATYSDHPEVVELFLFVNPIRQAADSTEALLVKVMSMQQRHRGWRPYWPSYSFSKGLQRTNAQVRHDRGGLTAGFYFRSQRELNKIMQDIQRSTYKPLPRHPEVSARTSVEEYKEEYDARLDRENAMKKSFRYKTWTVLHRLQGFETRFALKVIIVTSLLSVPAWLHQSRDWYNTYQSWWAVVMVWVMMHPRVGGNFQDLVTRSLTGVLGALWAGFAYAAGNGNRYVIAIFAAIYMIPMIYRFTQSSHPRSGIVGCISFTVVSLNALALHGSPSIVTIAWTHGVAFVVGVVSAVVVNWILWPFVARHELRKALSAMMLHSAILYRGVVANYIYYADGEEPGKEVIERSELVEGRLREGFVRIRQLMALTRHEIRLRAPFNPLPYSALIENCESFFEHLVEVRQSSLFFHPNYMSGNEAASEDLLPFRRDAVAAVLMNLYVLAGALRGDRKVPRYLPSAAAARKRLLDRMAEVEAEHAEARGDLIPRRGVGRKFAEVYQFAYSQALTACVEQLEQLQKYTKAICGEVGFDFDDDTIHKGL